MPAAVEIVASPGPVRVKGSVTPMPSFKSDSPPPKPAAAAAPVIASRPAAAAPPPAQTPPASTTVKPVEPRNTPAKDAMFQRMREKSGQVAPAAQPTPAEPKVEPETTEAPTTEPETQAEDTTTEPETTPAAPEETTTTPKEPGKKQKVDPWKLKEEWKTKAIELEKQLLETRKLIPDEVGRKAEVERLTAAEKRAQDLENEIRFVNYSKSNEYQEKYWKPYEDSYRKAVVELAELEVTSPETGETRKVTPQDFNDILFANSIVRAKAIATERFGDYAEDVMGFRKDVRKLYDAQREALETARTEGAEREKRMVEEHTTRVSAIRKEADEVWGKTLEASLSDPENSVYYKPVEGDEERNKILTKGNELVNSLYTENPLHPELTAEQRATIIKKQVAARNRILGYGVLKYELAKARTQMAALEEKLKQYEGTVPATEGGRAQSTTPATPVKAMDRAIQRLRSLAR